jgi:hypothetical protein
MIQFDANVFLEKCYNPGKRSLKVADKSLYYGAVFTATSPYGTPAAPITIHPMKVTDVKDSLK